MSRLFLVHGWAGSPTKDWFPWAKNELEKLGYEVVAPEMPDTDHPRIGPWVDKLTEVVGNIRESDIFIGHSIGCQAIERYFQILPPGTKVKTVILVAPWIKLTEETFKESEDSRQIVAPWYETPIEYEKVKEMAESWTAIFSDNDPWVSYEDNYGVYKDKLSAEIILEHGKGHFTKDEGVTEIPLLLDLIKN